MARFIATGNIIKGNECTIEGEIKALESILDLAEKYLKTTEEGHYARIEIAKIEINIEIIKDLIEDLRTERRRIIT